MPASEEFGFYPIGKWRRMKVSVLEVFEESKWRVCQSLGDLNKPLNLSGPYEAMTTLEGSELSARCPGPCLPYTDGGRRIAVSVL